MSGYVIPERVKRAIDNHVLHGHPCGGFVTSVLENNLTEAVGRADEESIVKLRDIVGYLYNCCPGPCWGSPAKVKAWRKTGGIPGWTFEQ